MAEPERIRDRPTADLIVLGLSVIVGFVVVVQIVGGLVLRIVDPDADIENLATRIADVTNTLIGAIVGYLAGRGASGKPKEPPLE